MVCEAPDLPPGRVTGGFQPGVDCATFGSMRLAGRSYRGPLEPLTGREAEVRDNLIRYVHVLADEIGERNVFCRQGLGAAERYIAGVLEGNGYRVNEQAFSCQGLELKNLEAIVPAAHGDAEAVVVGAHYDTVSGSPGANDNGSGVAALLELARLLRADTPRRTVRLVAFVNEEPPFFRTGMMGSLVYARRCREHRDRVSAMISLETIGSYSDARGSQSYPPMLSFFYPAVGDFVAFVSNLRSRRLLRRVVGSFRRNARFPSEGAALPSWVPGVGWSDQWSFWRVGYPAVMVTDTAFHRYRHYHTPWDTADKLDYDRTARVVTGLEAVIRDLAGSIGARL